MGIDISRTRISRYRNSWLQRRKKMGVSIISLAGEGVYSRAVLFQGSVYLRATINRLNTVHACTHS